MSVFRNAFVIVILTIASWLYARDRRSADGKYPIRILQEVPRGFKHLGQPTIDPELVKALLPELPVATIILFLEHIAISKCEYAPVELPVFTLLTAIQSSQHSVE